MFVACEKGNLEFLEYFLKRGADVNATNKVSRDSRYNNISGKITLT